MIVTKRKQAGLTMIEILIALFIMAVGLLGTATLQMRALQDTGNSNLRSVAVYLANDIADRIRANKAGIISGYLNSQAGGALDSDCIGATGCTVQEMANHDKAEWLANVAARLPGPGVGTFARNDSTGIYTVRVTWKERVKQSAAGVVDGSITLTFEP